MSKNGHVRTIGDFNNRIKSAPAKYPTARPREFHCWNCCGEGHDMGRAYIIENNIEPAPTRNATYT
jgi:hypothetical protein